ncbi:MAG: hypothetical protein QOH25_2048 [Acidobacteriota bacterium]|nr:hypothetical protein [Acidobacteriota bacterium]
MEKRQIRMDDGRYLIFYTFTDKTSPLRVDVEENRSDSAERQPEAKPEAEEERRV